ncbi:MAG TPA: hypothetical protein VI299_19145 [Polyangiales bacterium]
MDASLDGSQSPVADDARSGSDAAGSGRGLSDATYQRPDGGEAYVPQPGKCGFEKPAFCDSFETIGRDPGRTGELDALRWSVTRGAPTNPASLSEPFYVGPTKMPACRSDLPERAPAAQDTFICDPTASIPTRHLLTAAAAQNYGLNSYRIRQPFDFAGRTGTIKFDADLSHHGLGGWPAIVISESPSLAPSFDWEERGSGPQHGVSIEFVGGWCNKPDSLEVSLFTFRNYEQTAQRASFDCETPHVSTARDRLNHVEIYLTRGHLEVWASDPSPNGVDFPNFTRLYEADLDLPFERGYVQLLVRNHATMKYWLGSAATVRWDNVGFDGPLVDGFREHSASDRLTADDGLDGCMINGQCVWRGDAIAQHDDDAVCATSCMAQGQGKYVGYVVPRQDEPPVAIEIPNVVLRGATGARLALAATYPWFDWNGVSKPPTAIALRYRLNGGPSHDRSISDIEATAFTDFSPELGGAGHGSGFLNQIIELELSELRDGNNTLELQTVGTWTGDYRAGIAAADLILTAP